MIWWIIILTLAIAFLVAKRAGAGKWSWLILAAGGVIAVVAIISSAGGEESHPVDYVPPPPSCFETVVDTVWDETLDELIGAPTMKMGIKSQKVIVPTGCIMYEIRPSGATALFINGSNQPVPINPNKKLPQKILEDIQYFDAMSWAHGPTKILVRFARVETVQKQIPCASAAKQG